MADREGEESTTGEKGRRGFEKRRRDLGSFEHGTCRNPNAKILQRLWNRIRLARLFATCLSPGMSPS